MYASSSHREEDAVGQRVAAAQMMELGLARQDELSAALGVNRTTLYRQHQMLNFSSLNAYYVSPLVITRFSAGHPERPLQAAAAGSTPAPLAMMTSLQSSTRSTSLPPSRNGEAASLLLREVSRDQIAVRATVVVDAVKRSRILSASPT
jgi:hypothetical protein